jgi:hypothetical protein
MDMLPDGGGGGGNRQMLPDKNTASSAPDGPQEW